MTLPPHYSSINMHILVKVATQLLPGQHAAPCLVKSIFLPEFLVILPLASQLQLLSGYGLIFLLKLLVQRNDCFHKHLLLWVPTRFSLRFVLMLNLLILALSHLSRALLQ